MICIARLPLEPPPQHQIRCKKDVILNSHISGAPDQILTIAERGPRMKATLTVRGFAFGAYYTIGSCMKRLPSA